MALTSPPSVSVPEDLAQEKAEFEAFCQAILIRLILIDIICIYLLVLCE